MAVEKTQVLKMHVGVNEAKRFEIFDRLKRTDFTLSSGSWELIERVGGSVVLSGTCTPVNNDTDRAGNTIKTLNFNMNLDETDIVVGNYWLVLAVALSIGQTEVIRFPVEMVDLREVY